MTKIILIFGKNSDIASLIYLNLAFSGFQSKITFSSQNVFFYSLIHGSRDTFWKLLFVSSERVAGPDNKTVYFVMSHVSYLWVIIYELCKLSKNFKILEFCFLLNIKNYRKWDKGLIIQNPDGSKCSKFIIYDFTFTLPICLDSKTKT